MGHFYDRSQGSFRDGSPASVHDIQEQEPFLNVRGQVQQVHELRDPGS
jgi:hypothetical protein